MSTHPDKGLTTSHENLFTFHLLDSITIPTFAINTQHEITHWNKALEKATGFLAVDMIGTKNNGNRFTQTLGQHCQTLLLKAQRMSPLSVSIPINIIGLTC